MPDEQAAPDDTAMPSRSKEMTAVSAFMPSAAKRVVFGSRSAVAPKITAPGVTALRPVSSLSRKREHMVRLGGTLAAHGGRSRAECGDAGDIFRAGTQAALLAAAANQRIGEMNVLARAG